jgi:predicted alpha/beta-fold hydrolase
MIKQIKGKNKDCDLVAIGMSLGAGLLLKHTTVVGKDSDLLALAVVAAPFNHLHSAKNSLNWWPYLRIPGKAILSILTRHGHKLKHKLEPFADEIKNKGIDFTEVLNTKTYYEFDDKFTSKLHGFAGADEYYTTASPYKDLDKIAIPVFALSSLDDPIIHHEGLPVEEFKKWDNLLLMTTEAGGHVGFYEGHLWPKRWFHLPCLEFLDAIIAQSHNS